MRHRQPPVLPPAIRHLTRDPLHRGQRPGDHHGRRAVDRGHRHLVPGQQRQHVGLGGPHRQHRPSRRQRLHQPGACRHQRARVRQRQHPGHVRGGDLAQRVPGDHLGTDAPRLDQPEQRHLKGEQRGLGPARPVQDLGVLTPHDVPQRPVQHTVELRHDGVEGSGEHREPVVQPTTHPQPLRTLTREHHTDPTTPGGTLDDRVTDQGHPVVEVRPRHGQRQTDIHSGRPRPLVHPRPQARELVLDRGGGLARQHPRHHDVRPRRPVDRLHRGSLLQDHVRVRSR